MPPDQHGNPAEEPSPTSSPSQLANPAADGTAFTPGVLHKPVSPVMRIGRHPGNNIVVSDLGVSKQHAELRRTSAGRCSIIDLGSHAGTYVNGTRVSQQELNEGDIIAIGRATFRLAGGELIEYADEGADGALLAGMIVTRLERWLEREGVFEVPGAGHVELAGEIDREPGGAPGAGPARNQARARGMR